jgi:hypothetical protein
VAVGEVIANALDEQALTPTPSPEILRLMGPNGSYGTSDAACGMHLTQKEESRRLRHPAVIGQFGIGLKDALAVFDRR